MPDATHDLSGGREAVEVRRMPSGVLGTILGGARALDDLDRGRRERGHDGSS
jgi:hypothetical protein